MAKRSDGVETKQRLLAIARDVFVEHGFQKTTIVQISKAAETNVAAVNYHFGSKEGLYAEVWRIAFHEAHEQYPIIDPALAKDAAVAQRFDSFIRSRLHLFLDTGPANSAGKLLLQNLADPVPGIESVRHEMLRPLRATLRDLIKELIGPALSDERLSFCVMSTVNQFIAFGLHARIRQHSNTKHVFTQKRIEEFAQHTVSFCLSAFADIRRELQT